jgi:hypothetical protein
MLVLCRVLFAVCFVALVLDSTRAFGANDQVGLGSRPCSEFLAAPDSLRAVWFVWAQGFLSGTGLGWAAMTGHRVDLLPANRDPDWQLAFLRKYCVEQPAVPFGEAVTALFADLRQE